jgi:hypothetical protein
MFVGLYDTLAKDCPNEMTGGLMFVGLNEWLGMPPMRQRKDLKK